MIRVPPYDFVVAPITIIGEIILVYRRKCLIGSFVVFSSFSEVFFQMQLATMRGSSLKSMPEGAWTDHE